MAVCAFLSIVACSSLLAAAAPLDALEDILRRDEDCGAHGCDVESVSLLAIGRSRLVPVKFCCPDELHGVYADIHDGDHKEITLLGTDLTIKPYGNNESWTITATVDPTSCSTSVDFNVPGKPDPAPVPLSATLWQSFSKGDKHFEFEFTDPSGTLDMATKPLNRWLELEQIDDKLKGSWPCPTSLKAVYDDMHDGDQKEVTISGALLTIKPSGNDECWEVQSVVDPMTCSAVIDFNVDGKPGPPPVDLLATFWYTVSAAKKKTEYEFTDPSGTLAAPGVPVNCWVQVSAA